MSIVVGAASSTLFDVLFDNLSSPDLLKIFRQKNVDAEEVGQNVAENPCCSGGCRREADDKQVGEDLAG